MKFNPFLRKSKSCVLFTFFGSFCRTLVFQSIDENDDFATKKTDNNSNEESNDNRLSCSDALTELFEVKKNTKKKSVQIDFICS